MDVAPQAPPVQQEQANLPRSCRPEALIETNVLPVPCIFVQV
jgi:hypothetical protein